MDDDSLSVGMFLLLYTLFIIYLKYIENLTVVRGDFANFQCNPLYLLVDSMIENETNVSNSKFEGCVKKMLDKPVIK